MTALPAGVHLDLDPSVQSFQDGTVLTGGFPGRLIVLSGEGRQALDRLCGDGPVSESDRRLGRRLVVAGMAHPRLAASTGPEPVGPDVAEPERAGPDITVIVPARDRPDLLDRCLSSLGGDLPVVVVDDGSEDPASVADVCERHGARLLRLRRNRGPGAARNHALAAVGTELVAFVDSDCTVGEGWLPRLTSLFEDVELGAVAPRIQRRGGRTDRTVLARFAAAHSPLDMGPERSEVGPVHRVRYTPTAALVARREALGEGFDPGLRVGEDVDLVWRLTDAGWGIRFEPSVTVWHDEPTTWAAWVRRRFRYGTSAGPLARRHPGCLAPIELRAWPSAIVAAALAGRPALSGALLTVSTGLTYRSVRRHGIPLPQAARWCSASAGWTLLGLGRASTVLAGPALAMVVVRGGRRARAAALVLLLAPPLVDWWRRRPDLDPLRWSLACLLDDLAYGAGVWAGSIRTRSTGPLVPSFRARQWAT